LAAAVRDPDRLCQLLRLPEIFWPDARRAARLFPLLVPHSYLGRIEPGNPDDPLLRQVLPIAPELEQPPGFTPDPVGDEAARVAPGLLHKYDGRVLLIATGTCAVHCRYCFRRHYPYHAEPRRLDEWRPALDAIAADPSIHEVILSGGDPLVLADDRLEALVTSIASIPHVSRLRLHTRLPVVLPARVTDRLLEILAEAGPTPVMVVHANHAREIAGDCRAALRKVSRSGIMLLNQSVLLAGVNDSVDALASLSNSLIDVGATPYYLHQLDRVTGAAHFEVPEARGVELLAQLRTLLPGYAVPRYVRESPGDRSKTPIAD